MSGKKWSEYQNMTTHAKKFGGANNYQALLIALGSVSTLGILGIGQAIKWYKNQASSKKHEKIYTVIDLPGNIKEEFKTDKINIPLGTKFKVGNPFYIDDESSVFIDIINDNNNPYLLKESVVELISNYSSTKNAVEK